MRDGKTRIIAISLSVLYSPLPRSISPSTTIEPLDPYALKLYMGGYRTVNLVDEEGRAYIEENPLRIVTVCAAVSELKDEELLRVFGSYITNVQWALWNWIKIKPKIAQADAGGWTCDALHRGLVAQNPEAQLVAARILQEVVAQRSSVAEYFRSRVPSGQ